MVALVLAGVVLLGAGCATQPGGIAGDRLQDAEAGAHTLGVVTYNIGGMTGGPTAPQAVAGVLEAAPTADVYLLQEVWSLQHLERIGGSLEAVFGSGSGGGADESLRAPAFHTAYALHKRLGILSRYPLTECRAFHPPGMPRSHGALRCRVLLPGRRGPLAVVAVHLRHIPKARNEQGFVQTGGGSMAGTLFREAVFPTVRSRAAHSITEWLSTWPVRRAIVAGDFNTVPFTRTIRRMNRRYEEALCGTGGYLSGTYWKVEGSILPRVDFIFHSEELDRRRAFVIEEKAGDHFPVYAEFNLSEGE